MNPNVLEKYREKLGLSKQDLAAKMGKTPGWYTRIAKGDHPLRPRYIAPMAEVFKIKPEQLAKEYFAGHQLEDTSKSNKAAASS